MRRRPVLIAAAIAASLLLTACGDDTEPEAQVTEAPVVDETPAVPEPTEADVAALEAVTVDGAVGTEPTLDFDQPFEVSAPVARVETEGDGDTLVNGQTLEINYLMVNGDDGASLGSTWALGASESLVMGDPRLISTITEVLQDQKVGVRILAALPGTPETAEAPAAPSTIMVLEVVDARDVPTRAEGEAVEPPAGLPIVTLAESGEPSIEIPADVTEPTELVVQPLIKGDGPLVEAGQTISVHYSGWLWDGTQFDSSWQRGAPMETSIGTGNLIEGWDTGLVGQPVGSQVLLVIPSEQGYGAAGSGSIPPDATLIFVVDILEAR